MKKLFLILAILLACSTASFSQNVPKDQPVSVQNVTWEDLPHSKGNWEFLFREYASYSNREYEFDDIELGSQSEFMLNLDTKYFVADHIGIGAVLMYETNKIKSVLDAIEKTNEWMAWGNFTYMTNLSGNINLYGEGSIGFGGIKQSYEYGSIEEDESYSRFGYKLALGLPVRVARNSPLYLTPELQYRGITTDYDNGKEKENRFGFEPEVIARLARIPGIRIYEVGISYYGRTYEEGKKINWKDGFRAIYCIIKYNLFP